MSALSLKPLPLADADLAFPLVQMMRPGVSLASWRQYVAHCATGMREAGVTVLTDETGYIQGMFSWVVRIRLGAGRVLTTEEFGFVYAADPRPAGELLLQRIEELARDRHCQQVRITMPRALEEVLRQRGGEPGDLFAARGYRTEGTTYSLVIET